MDPTQSTGAQYEAMAEAWEEGGYKTPADPSFGEVSRMFLWIHSPGGKKEGASQRLRNFVDALRGVLDKKYPGWYDGQFDDHDYCKVCGERYSWENLSMCTHCSAAICPSHRYGGGLAANDNYLCPSCGVGEVIG
jgi:hypothetical protein